MITIFLRSGDVVRIFRSVDVHHQSRTSSQECKTMRVGIFQRSGEPLGLSDPLVTLIWRSFWAFPSAECTTISVFPSCAYSRSRRHVLVIVLRNKFSQCSVISFWIVRGERKGRGREGEEREGADGMRGHRRERGGRGGRGGEDEAEEEEEGWDDERGGAEEQVEKEEEDVKEVGTKGAERGGAGRSGEGREGKQGKEIAFDGAEPAAPPRVVHIKVALAWRKGGIWEPPLARDTGCFPFETTSGRADASCSATSSSDESFFWHDEQQNHQNSRICWGLHCLAIVFSFSHFLAHAGYCHTPQELVVVEHVQRFGCRAALGDNQTPLRLTASQTATTRGVLVSGTMGALDIAQTLHFVEPDLQINCEE